MVSVLGKLSKEGIVAEMNNKHFISVMADGTRDAAGIENETVFCWFIQDGQPVNRLMGHKVVEHTHAEGKRKIYIRQLLAHCALNCPCHC